MTLLGELTQALADDGRDRDEQRGQEIARLREQVRQWQGLSDRASQRRCKRISTPCTSPSSLTVKESTHESCVPLAGGPAGAGRRSPRLPRPNSRPARRLGRQPAGQGFGDFEQEEKPASALATDMQEDVEIMRRLLDGAFAEAYGFSYPGCRRPPYATTR